MSKRTRKIDSAFPKIMSREALHLLANRCYSKVGLASAAGVGSQKLTTAYAAVIDADGYIYSIAAQTSFVPANFSTAAYGCASGMARLYFVAANGTSSFFMYAGSAVSAGTTTYGPTANIPVSHVVIGMFKVSMSAALSFTPGTNMFTSAMGLEFWDVSRVPQGVIIDEE